ncbi:MAG: dolichyl-phosphate beta-glucosyltransferase [Parcubacteria group bacterium]
MDKKPYLSVIIPAYNEAERIPATLIDIDKHLRGADFDYEILVVNDGSKDNTVDVVSKFLPLVKGLRLVGEEINHGKGYVIRKGMAEATGKFKLFTDADNSTTVDHFFKMIPYLEGIEGKKYDIVIGSRDIKGAKLIPPQSFYRRILGNLGNIFIQLFLLPRIWDTQCGFKCFSEESAARIFPFMKINRWAIDVEALALGKKLGYKIKEIPVTWVNDTRSRVKSSAYFGVLRDVLKIRFWLWTNRYKITKQK